MRNELDKTLEQELTGLEQPMGGVEGLYKQLDIQSKAYEDLSGAVK